MRPGATRCDPFCGDRSRNDHADAYYETPSRKEVTLMNSDTSVQARWPAKVVARLSSEQAEQLQQMAEELQVTTSSLVRAAVASYITAEAN